MGFLSAKHLITRNSYTTSISQLIYYFDYTQFIYYSYYLQFIYYLCALFTTLHQLFRLSNLILTNASQFESSFIWTRESNESEYIPVIVSHANQWNSYDFQELEKIFLKLVFLLVNSFLYTMCNAWHGRITFFMNKAQVRPSSF